MAQLPITLVAEPLTPTAYQPYGQVVDIESAAHGNMTMANQGTAKRYNHVADLINLRNGNACTGTNTHPTQPNLCIFQCQPQRDRPLEMALLEHHPFSTQLFVPMHSRVSTNNPLGPKRYLVVVAENSHGK